MTGNTHGNTSDRIWQMSEKIRKNLSDIPLDDYASILNIADRMVKNKKIVSDSKKIAVLGTHSIQMIVKVLDAMLMEAGLPMRFYEGEYNGLAMDILDSHSAFYSFRPDIVILLPSYTDIKEYPNMMADEERVREMARSASAFFQKLYSAIHAQLPNAHIFCSNLIEPYARPLGNLEGNVFYSQSCFVSLVNLEWIIYKPDYVTILDMRGLAERIGLDSWYDSTLWFLSKQGFSLKYIGAYCNLMKQQILALSGRIKKCLVIDLDNTIWGGAVGDTGYNGIVLEPNDPEGEAFLAFQRYICQLKERGVILAVCSKNDEQNAKEPFEKNPYMLLKSEDISCFVANWDDKVSNISRIAEELNIGTDSMVFFDDNPTERALVRRFLPEVEVVEVPEDPALYVNALDSAQAFDWIQITKEDIGRTDTYVADKKREDLKLDFSSYDEYLAQLQMCGRFCEVDAETVSRFTQLLNKTNQFNLTTNRYSEAQIQAMADSDEYGLYATALKDAFSDYGIIACVILLFDNEICRITDWCMSCRVLKKDIENFTMKKIIEICSQRGCGQIAGKYLPTKKNQMVKNLYAELGFEACGNGQFILTKEQFWEAKTKSFIKEETR